MNDSSNADLLRAYAERRSEPAFAELVRRHVDLVYSAARRLVCDSHLAEDVTQAVFLALANNAAPLAERAVLSGWLHRTTLNLATNMIRSDSRRRAREQEAALMNELLSAESDAAWEHVAPHLDAALDELNEPDRDALLLRYFERKSAREMADLLGISDEAAQKRVTRAVERLREFFGKRGVAIGVSGLIALISANAVQAAPAGLALTISTAAVLAGTTLAAATTVTATKIIAMTALKKTLVTATVAILAGAGIYEARQAAQSRDDANALRLAQTPLLEQLAGLQAENERLSNQVARARAPGLSREQLSELLNLRNRAGSDSRELAALRSALAQQGGKIPDVLAKEVNDFLTSIADQGRQVFTNGSLNRVKRLSTVAGLTARQQESVREIFLANVETRAQMEVARMSGDLSLDEIMNRKDKITEEEDRLLAGVLTPEQMADYQKMKVEGIQTEDKNWMNAEVSIMKHELKLNDEQTGRVSSTLSSLKPGDGGRGITYYSNAREQLETRLRAFENILTPQQLQAYRQMKLDDIEDHEKIPRVIQALKQQAPETIR